MKVALGAILLLNFVFVNARHGRVQVYETFCPDKSSNMVTPVTKPSPVTSGPITSGPVTPPPTTPCPTVRTTKATTRKPSIFSIYRDIVDVAFGHFGTTTAKPQTSTCAKPEPVTPSPPVMIPVGQPPVILLPPIAMPPVSPPVSQPPVVLPPIVLPPVVIPPVMPPVSVPPPVNPPNQPNCPDCIAGQGVLPDDQWAQLHFNRPGPPDGNCPGNRSKIIFMGNPNKCCCNPNNNPRSNDS